MSACGTWIDWQYLFDAANLLGTLPTKNPDYGGSRFMSGKKRIRILADML